MKAETQYLHAKRYYDELLSLSRQEFQQTGPEPYLVVFRGKLGEVFRELALPNSYYSPIKEVLDRHECLEVIQQGNRAQDSVVVLRQPPPGIPPDDFTKDRLTEPADRATLEKRIEALEAWRESQKGLDVIKVLRNMEIRLNALESGTQQDSNTNQT